MTINYGKKQRKLGIWIPKNCIAVCAIRKKNPFFIGVPNVLFGRAPEKKNLIHALNVQTIYVISLLNLFQNTQNKKKIWIDYVRKSHNFL